MQNRIQNILNDRPREKSVWPMAVAGFVMAGFLAAGAATYVYASTETAQIAPPAASAGETASSGAPKSQAMPEQKVPMDAADSAKYINPLPGHPITYSDEDTADLYDVPVGTPVLSAADGTVVEAERRDGPVVDGEELRYGLLGKYVVVEDANGNQFFYAHLDAVSVHVGDSVEAGGEIGRSGNTGNAAKSGQLDFRVKDPTGALITTQINPHLENDIPAAT